MHFDHAIIITIATLSFLFGIWGIHTHTFEGDDFFYLKSGSFGRPLSDVVFKTLQALFESNSGAYHIGLIALHILATGIGAYALYGITKNRDLTIVASALFLVNVSHFRTLHWISCIGYPIALSFGLLSLLMQKKDRPLSSFLCLATGMAAHPGILLFPLIGILWRAYRISLILFLSAASIGYALTIIYPNAPQSAHVTLPDFALVFKNILWYMGRLTTSFATVFPQMNEVKNVELPMGIGLLILCSFMTKRNIWALFLIVAILPFITNPIFNDWPAGPSRHLYFASFGMCVLIGQLICHIKIGHRLLVMIVLAIVLMTCGFSLQKARAQSAYLEGRGHIAHGDYSVGLSRYRFAIDHAPELVPEDIYFRASMMAFSLGQAATPFLFNAPQTPTTTMLRDVSALLEGDEETFQQHLFGAIDKINEPKLASRTSKALFNLGGFYFKQNQYKQAAAVANLALKFDPDNQTAENLLNSAKHQISKKQQ